MSWTQLHERMAVMAAVIEKATEDPEAALNATAAAPDVERLFGGEEGLLLSLRQRWVTMLTARLDQADHEGLPAERAVADLVAAQPGLHALLDIAAQRSKRVANLRAGEQRIIDLYQWGLPGTGRTVA